MLILRMKTCSILLILIVLSALQVFAQEVIDIVDRKNLPQAVYDSLESSRTILLGEVHGTNEAPEFAEGVIKLWLKNRQQIILALEFPVAEQKYIDTFLS